MIERNEERYIEFRDKLSAISECDEKIESAQKRIKALKVEFKDLERKIKFNNHSIDQLNFQICVDLALFLKTKLDVLDIPMLWTVRNYNSCTFGIPKLDEERLKRLEGYRIQISPDGSGGYIITGEDILKIMRKDYKEAFLGEGTCLEEEICYR
jgi:hypothetical protein